MIGDAMEDSAFNSMMSINHIGSKSIAEIRQQSIHSFVQLRLVFIQNFRIFKSFDLSNSTMYDTSTSFDSSKNWVFEKLIIMKTAQVQNRIVRVLKGILNASGSSNLVQVRPMISPNMDMVNELSKFGVLSMSKQEADSQTDY